MAEKCKHAYRKPGKNAVFCKAIEGDDDWCINQNMCWQTQRVEAMPVSGQCRFKNQKPVK